MGKLRVKQLCKPVVYTNHANQPYGPTLQTTHMNQQTMRKNRENHIGSLISPKRRTTTCNLDLYETVGFSNQLGFLNFGPFYTVFVS